MIDVKKDWWKDYFNEIYLITDGRSVCDEVLTRREADLIEKLLDLNKDDRVLDLFGGQGRHSLELAKRGYRDLTVLDYSPYLIKTGKKSARTQNLKIKFYRKDARFTGLKSKTFSVILVMASSFGYFQDEKDDIRVLKEIKRLLKEGGKLLLDLTDADYIKDNLDPLSSHEAGEDIIVCRRRALKEDLMKVKEIVISKKTGLIRDGSYSERLYTDRKITNILKDLGYKDISIHKGISLHKQKKDYGFLTSRMMVRAGK